MNTEQKKHFLLIAFSVLAILICAYMFYDFRAQLRSTVKELPENVGQVNAIGERLSKIELQLNTLNTKINEIKTGQNNLKALANNQKSKQSDETLNEYLVSVNQTVYKLEDILEASGIMSIATNDLVDASILSDVYQERLNMKAIEQYDKVIMALAKTQTDSDLETYGEEITKIAKAARYTWGKENAQQTQARQNAYDELLRRYPDSYAAGKAISERAIRAVFKENSLAEAEKYYQQLSSNPKYTEMVHDQWHTKPFPNIQNKLASLYIEAGRFNEAEAIITELEKNPNDRVWGGKKGQRTVAESIKSLRKEME